MQVEINTDLAPSHDNSEIHWQWLQELRREQCTKLLRSVLVSHAIKMIYRIPLTLLCHVFVISCVEYSSKLCGGHP